MMEILGSILVLLGAVFLFLASLGLIRMPDVYNRMQAGTKATTLGSILVFLGFLFYAPEFWSRYTILILFVFLTNPLSSHALARAAHRMGIPAIIPKGSNRQTQEIAGCVDEEDAQDGEVPCRDDLETQEAGQ